MEGNASTSVLSWPAMSERSVEGSNSKLKQVALGTLNLEPFERCGNFPPHFGVRLVGKPLLKRASGLGIAVLP